MDIVEGRAVFVEPPDRRTRIRKPLGTRPKRFPPDAVVCLSDGGVVNGRMTFWAGLAIMGVRQTQGTQHPRLKFCRSKSSVVPRLQKELGTRHEVKTIAVRGSARRGWHICARLCSRFHCL